jgi:hypothetical protein
VKFRRKSGEPMLPAGCGGQEYRLKAWSADGHGVERSVLASGEAGESGVTQPAGRSGLLLAGLGGIFGLFGLWQLYLRRR